MEEKLKKQRNKLFTRIILILLAVWIVISAVFCAVRLNIEKANVQSRELSKLSHFSQLLTVGNGDLDNFSWAFIENGEFFYDKNKIKQEYDSQMVFTDRQTGDTVLDTAGKIGVQYSIRLEDKATFNFVTLLDYDLFRGSLNDEQLDRIKAYLDTQREDGNYYELICSKMHCGLELIPLELRIVLVNGKDNRLIVDDNVETFDLSANLMEGYEVDESSSTWLNSVPKSFLFDAEYGTDYIGSLTKEQQKNTVDMIPSEMLEYTFYAFDYVKFTDESNNDYQESWRVQYAKKVNLFDSCKTDLLIGVGLIFFFFLTIAITLCVMIWRTVKAQIIGEQKRLDLTNALAHDIKTPLFVISGYAYSLKEDIDAGQRETYLDRIIEQTDTVNDLVHRMLSFSKLDSYSMELNQTDFDLRETVEEILQDYTALPDHKTIAFTHSGGNRITADKELLTTALKNLIDNAVKYSLPDSEIQVDVTDKTFSIMNKTEPLSKAELKDIWQPYVRKDKSRHQKGNGLGLSIVKSILDLHGAKYAMEMNEDTLKCWVKLS